MSGVEILIIAVTAVLFCVFAFFYVYTDSEAPLFSSIWSFLAAVFSSSNDETKRMLMEGNKSIYEKASDPSSVVRGMGAGEDW